MKGLVCLPLVFAAFGCASALKEPPTAGQLAAGHETAGTLSRATDELLVEAEHEMSLAPDLQAVERALALFLQAIGSDDAPLGSFLGAARASAWLVEHVTDPAQRKVLATEGVQIGQLCRQQYPDAAECRYRLALAVGQQARERPSTGKDGLDVMVELLEELIEDAPRLDQAGPHRVLALVLLRAPGWPSGPGDPEFALEQAHAAVILAPDYAPNQLALGEALAANDEEDSARITFEYSIQLAREQQATGNSEAAEWIQQGLVALDDLD